MISIGVGMNNIIDLFQRNKNVGEYQNIIKEGNYDLLVNNTTANHNYLLAYLTFLKTEDTVVYVASNLYKATTAYEMLCEIAGFENVNFYIVEEIMSAELLAISKEFKFERIHTVNSIIKGEKKIIVTSINALARELLPKHVLIEHVLNFSQGDIIDINNVVRLLVESGYTRVPMTTEVGDFSIRGGLIDIYPINMDGPIRIDLFDYEIDFIKTFDITSQKTIEKIKNASVFPLNELIYNNPIDIIKRIKDDCGEEITISVENDLMDIENYHNLEKSHKYIRYISKELMHFLDYIDNKIVLFEEIKRIEESYEKAIYELYTYLESKPQPKKLNLSYLSGFHDVFVDVNKRVYLSEFRQSLNNIHIDKTLDLQGHIVIDYQNDIKNLVLDLKANKDKTFIITTSTNESMNLIVEILKDNEIKGNLLNESLDIKPKSINIIQIANAISFGFINDFEVINETNIFKKMKFKRTKYRSAYQNTTPINSKDDLKVGDYIVHYDYGIGQYLGIKTVELQDIKNDYIMLRFENMELYIPVEKVNLLEKYQGSENSAPRLTSIGTNEWEKKKAKVRTKLESIAHELIEIQAYREQQTGYKYREDDYLQKEFENDFEFVETPDQKRTIDEIKVDMEKGLIIDRLVCGDVGYGKTEIAMRIAFKTVVNGKQVSYLAPTTILSRQHYHSFKDRFAKYGIRVELLNRLISPAEQSRIVSDLRDGKVDIIIGTHRILNDEIVYKNLGLLIVDEEQRFGVTHKEKIKKYKNNINVLTLTATPIPRTLQMAIMGVRQLSLIETPPQNRYPIQTYVLEENEVIIRETIYREIGRNGQVFYLHNRITDIERVGRKIRRLVPEARVLVVHGKMDKNLLEDSIQAFIDHEYDVLLCTTIIETGIDIPNTNTLIVDMSDRLGLSQMYQIRGRVGRSDRVSYAYFMYDQGKVLTDTSAKRLNAIKEFTTLGSGYKIAVRDLAIRGAGDILGREQSGFIDSIGLDMYMKILTEEIDRVKGIIPPVKENINLELEVSQHVDDSYVSDDDIKIYIHRSISQIKSKQERDDVVHELTDRFGKLNKEILLYIDKKYMESLANKCGIESIEDKNKQTTIIYSQEASNSMNAGLLFKEASKLFKSVKFEYRRKRIYIFITNENNSSIIKKVITLLESIGI